MGKNNSLINRYRDMYRKIQQLTPEVYAGIALALHREYGWGYQRIYNVFAASQAIWKECVESDKNMVQMCLDETGIDVKAEVEREV